MLLPFDVPVLPFAPAFAATTFDDDTTVIAVAVVSISHNVLFPLLLSLEVNFQCEVVSGALSHTKISDIFVYLWILQWRLIWHRCPQRKYF